MRSILTRLGSNHLADRLNLLVAVTLIPMILVQALVFWYWYETRRDTVYEANLELARHFGLAFERYVEDLARNQQIIGEAVFLAPESERSTLLERYRGLYPVVVTFALADTTGRVLAASRPEAEGMVVAERSYFRQVVEGADWVLSDLLESKLGGERVILARGIRVDSELRAVLLAEINPDKLEGVLARAPTQGRLLTLFDRRGHLVALIPASESRIAQAFARPDGLAVQLLREGTDVTGTWQPRPDITPRLAVRTRIPTSGWIAGVSRPVAEAMEPVRRSIYFMIVPVVLVILASVLVARKMAITMIRSLTQLREGAMALAAGKTREVEAPGIAELADLARTFNQMSAELTRHTASLERATQELTRSNQELEAFSYSVSHDLRAPLRAIDGFSNAVQEDYGPRLDAEGQRFLNLIRENAQRMGQLIDDLLAYSRLGRRQLRREEIDMEALIRQVAEEIVPGGRARLSALEVQPLPRAYADRTLLRQALSNLLSNAFKFSSHRDEPRIVVKGREEVEGNVYCISDNGAGFDMQYAGKLFGIFQRLHPMNEFPGTGVGLAIVQRVIRKHGGRVWGEGEVDKGSDFCFSLPRRQS
jgi:signal transduction histidine kinase